MVTDNIIRRSSLSVLSMPSSSSSPSQLRQASLKFFFICQSGWASTTSISTAIFIIIDDDNETGSSSKPTRIPPKTNTSSIPISDKAKYEAEAGFYEGWVLASKAWSSGYAGVLRLVMLLTYNGVLYLRLLPNPRCTTRITTTIITSSKLNISICSLSTQHQCHHLDMVFLEWCMLPLLLSIRHRLSIINRWDNPRQRCWVNMDHHHLSSVPGPPPPPPTQYAAPASGTWSESSNTMVPSTPLSYQQQQQLQSHTQTQGLR